MGRRNSGSHRLTRNNAPLPAWLVVTLENSPSKVAAADQPLSHFISAEAVTRGSTVRLCRTIDHEGGDRQRLKLVLKSCAHAAGLRR